LQQKTLTALALTSTALALTAVRSDKLIHPEFISQAPEATSPDVESKYAALDLLIVLARHKSFILKFTLGCAVLALIVSFLLPNQYIAETLVIPPAQSSSSGAAALMSQLAGAGGGALASLASGSLGIKNTGEMYVSLFKSRTVEDAVIQRFGLMSRYKAKRMYDARKEFEDHATVVLGAKDGLIRIKVRDQNPQLSAKIANGYVDEFRKLTANLAITEAGQRRLFFQQQLREAKDNLTTAEEEMKGTQQSTGVLQIDSQAKSLIEAASLLRGQIVEKQVQIQAMRSYATEDNPEILMAKQQLSALEAQLSKLAGSEQDSNSEFIVPKGKVPEVGMEYLRKYRDLKYRETVYELIAKQFEMAKLDEARQGAIVQVADEAVTPDKKSSPPRSIIVVLVMLLAFIIAILWAIVAEGLAKALQDSEQYSRIQTLRQLLSRKQ
jgi:tyrosine-protein kinase Etk/Wzc